MTVGSTGENGAELAIGDCEKLSFHCSLACPKMESAREAKEMVTSKYMETIH